MRKIHVVICLLIVALCLSACSSNGSKGNKTPWEISAENALLSTSYGIRTHDRTLLLETYAKTTITYNGLQLSLAHAMINELHKRVSAHSNDFDVPERLNPSTLGRDKSENGSVFSYMLEVFINDSDSKMYVGLLPRPFDREVYVKHNLKNGYPKSIPLTTTCEGMNEAQCSQAIATEALDIAKPDYELNKAIFVK